MEKKNQQRFLIEVKQFIEREKLLAPGDEVLCAVSGGVDSMALLYALHSLKYKVQVAHFNFKLRGEASEEDMQFVENQAKILNLPFHLGAVPDSTVWDESPEMSVQQKARNLRYEWFETLKRQTGISRLALGHHADDQAETIVMNFLRGTGPAGLRGMLPHREGYIRPLLQKTKESIIAYATETHTAWREDASNSTGDYRRNQLRHRLWPVLQSITPRFQRAIIRNADRLRHIEVAMEEWFQELQLRFSIPEKEGSVQANWVKILETNSGFFFLEELFRRQGFEGKIVHTLAESGPVSENRVWYNHSGYVLQVKGNRLVISAQAKLLDVNGIAVIEKPQLEAGRINGDFGTIFFDQNPEPPVDWKKVPKTECWLDSDSIRFPLSIQRWQDGDAMRPFGMGGKSKKVSDLLTEAGLSPVEKKQTLKLSDANGNILWIPGLRTSCFYPITSATIHPIRMVWEPMPPPGVE